jgi:hypothetical protein
MTRLTKAVKREVAAEASRWSKDVVMVVSLTPAGVTLREKGRRTTYGPLPYSWLYLQGAKLKAEQTIRERKAARKARRAEK